MKTYILRDLNSVQPQKAQFVETVPTAQFQPQSPSAAPLQPTAPLPSSPSAARPATLFIGLDERRIVGRPRNLSP
jgi:hypothetical protein